MTKQQKLKTNWTVKNMTLSTGDFTPELPDVSKTLEMKMIEKRFGNRDIRFIIREAIETTGSQRQAAKMLAVHEAALANWMPRLRLTVKPVVIIEGLEL
jgi:hypothetical protein